MSERKSIKSSSFNVSFSPTRYAAFGRSSEKRALFVEFHLLIRPFLPEMFGYRELAQRKQKTILPWTFILFIPI